MRRRCSKLTLILQFCVLAVLASGCADSGPRRWNPFAKKEELGPKILGPAQRMESLRKLAKVAPKMSPADQESRGAMLAQAIAKEEDALVRAEMVRTLGSFSTPGVVPVLTAAGADSDTEVRVAACDAWARRGGTEAAQQLGEILSSDTDIDVRLAAARGLGRVDDKQAIASLGIALEDPDPALQHRAVLSLREVSGKDFGNDVNAWREYVAGGSPKPPSLVSKLRQLF